MDDKRALRRAQGYLTAIAAVLLGLILPAVAHAGDESDDLGTEGGLNYRVNVAEDFIGPAYNSFANCLEGDRPIAGGIDLSGSANTSRMGGTYPAKEGFHMWRSQGLNLGAGAMDMSFFAICRQIQPDVSKFRSVSRTYQPGKRRTVKAPCPDGFQVTGGGIQAASPVVSATLPYDGKDADKKPDDGWKATAINTFGIADDLTAFASCRKAGTWDLKYPKEEATVGGGSSVVGTNVCVDGVVTGGGGSISSSSELVRIHETYPSDVGDADDTPADGWTTSLRNGEMGNAAGAVYAICKN